MPYLAMFLERQGFLGMHWEVTSSLGVRRSFPFVTRELLELGFECHPSELVGPGTKRLLRAALAGDVPAINLERPDKGRPRAPARERTPRPGRARSRACSTPSSRPAGRRRARFRIGMYIGVANW